MEKLREFVQMAAEFENLRLKERDYVANDLHSYASGRKDGFMMAKGFILNRLKEVLGLDKTDEESANRFLREIEKLSETDGKLHSEEKPRKKIKPVLSVENILQLKAMDVIDQKETRRMLGID
jgi:hypothetical protein